MNLSHSYWESGRYAYIVHTHKLWHGKVFLPLLPCEISTWSSPMCLSSSFLLFQVKIPFPFSLHPCLYFLLSISLSFSFSLSLSLSFSNYWVQTTNSSNSSTQNTSVLLCFLLSLSRTLPFIHRPCSSKFLTKNKLFGISYTLS